VKYKLTPTGDKEYWGPVSIAVGATCLLSLFSFSISSLVNWITLICGLALVILGGCITPHNKNKIWGRIGITSGLSFFFWGIRIVSTNPINGWFFYYIFIRRGYFGFYFVT